ncbi:Glutaredoxin-C9 [Castilleja foliolosa]|uniref:Glutaredoxin-C9 n=1 Tax=Castilleja foliolosa TaxID=1961234 RepID=A0ABD3BCU5_9LAMI
MQVKRDLSFAEATHGGGGDMEAMLMKSRVLISGSAVVVFTVRGCCMCHVVKQLLFGLGVGPTILELHGDVSGGEDIQEFLRRISGERQAVVPAVFVGGRFLGGIETVLACHINGTLVPLLKDVGALWL